MLTKILPSFQSATFTKQENILSHKAVTFISIFTCSSPNINWTCDENKTTPTWANSYEIQVALIASLTKFKHFWKFPAPCFSILPDPSIIKTISTLALHSIKISINTVGFLTFHLHCDLLSTAVISNSVCRFVRNMLFLPNAVIAIVNVSNIRPVFSDFLRENLRGSLLQPSLTLKSPLVWLVKIDH